MGNMIKIQWHYLGLAGLVFTLSQPLAIAEDLDHSNSAAGQEKRISAMDDFMNRYFMKDSPIRAAEERSTPMAEADLVVHFFQQGPEGNGVFKELKVLSGKRCEKSEDMEFAMRWERGADGVLRPTDATMMVGPHYSFKNRVDKKGLYDRYNIPQPLMGEYSPFGLEAGDFSSAFAGEEFQKFTSNGKLQVTTLLDQSSDSEMKFKITEPGRAPYNTTVDLQDDAYLKTGFGRASLMPFAVKFTPKNTPFDGKNAPLFTDKTWLRRDDDGTAIHGADKHHLCCRPDNAGSAGCARVNSTFAKRTFEAFRKHLEDNGAVVSDEGNLYIQEREVEDSKGRHVADKLVDTPENLKNIKALLALRSKTSIKGLVMTSPVGMAKFYRSRNLALWNEVQKAYQEHKLGPELTQLFDKTEAIKGQIIKLIKAKGDQATIDNLKAINKDLISKYEDIVKTTAESPRTLFSDLHPSVQKTYLNNKQALLYEKIARDNPSEANKPMSDLTKEELDLYAANKADTHHAVGRALEEFYDLQYGKDIPQKCLDQIAAFKEYKPATPKKAIPVVEPKVLKAIPIQ